MQEYTHSWMDERIVVAPSPIDGLGLFARRPIPGGTVVLQLRGLVIDDAALAQLPEPYSSVVLGADRHLLIDPGDPVRYGNHSCDPNVWNVDATQIAARRDIAAGEELTVDYATQTGVESWSMPCRCGFGSCRKQVTGRDWRLPELQAAYGNHWSPVLLERIRRLG